MPRCETCGNDYEQAIKVVVAEQEHFFDCFECAIQAIAPQCGNCGCRVIGHGVQAGGIIYCCDHCANETRKKITPIRKALIYENAH